MIVTKEIVYNSKGNTDIIDITSDVQAVISDGKFSEGQALVFVPGATASVTTIEIEGGLLEDFRELFERIAPDDMMYAHHDDNGHSHVRASLLGPSETIPFKNKKLLLGTWQSIIVVDFDTRPRNRRVIIQLVGE